MGLLKQRGTILWKLTTPGWSISWHSFNVITVWASFRSRSLDPSFDVHKRLELAKLLKFFFSLLFLSLVFNIGYGLWITLCNSDYFNQSKPMLPWISTFVLGRCGVLIERWTAGREVKTSKSIGVTCFFFKRENLLLLIHWTQVKMEAASPGKAFCQYPVYKTMDKIHVCFMLQKPG